MARERAEQRQAAQRARERELERKMNSLTATEWGRLSEVIKRESADNSLTEEVAASLTLTLTLVLTLVLTLTSILAMTLTKRVCMSKRSLAGVSV